MIYGKRYFTVTIAGLVWLAGSLAFPSGQDDGNTRDSPIPPGFFGTYEPAIETTWGGVSQMENNPWDLLIQKELGINVTYVPINQHPDVVSLEGNNKFRDMQIRASAGKLADMTDVWAQYASPLAQEITGTTESGIFDALRSDGRLMAIPGSMSTFDSYSFLWLRQDWLDHLGLSAPNKTEELMQIATAFTHNDPDGDGVDDTFAMILDKSLWGSSEGFFWSFGAYPDTWLIDGSRLVYGGVQSETKDALKALREMYEDGQIDRDWWRLSRSEAARALADIAGIAYGNHGMPFDLLVGWSPETIPRWNAFAPPSISGGPVRGELDPDMRVIYGVRHDYQYPESLVKMSNLYWEALYGPTGDYSYWSGVSGSGGLGGGRSNMSSSHWINWRAYRDIQSVYEGTTRPESLRGVSLDYYNNLTSHPDLAERWAWRTIFGLEGRSPFDTINRLNTEGKLFEDNFFGQLDMDLQTTWVSLKGFQLSVFVEIVTGVRAVADFDMFVQDWLDGGGAEITDAVSAWYRHQQ